MDFLGYMMGSAPSAQKAEDEHDGEVSDDSSGDESEEPALKIFKSVLKQGLNIVQYGASGPACTVHLTLKRDVLYWTGGRSLTNGKRELPIQAIHYVDVGKNTPALESASAAGIPDDFCFSLVTADEAATSFLPFGNPAAEQTLDLQAANMTERDALTQGISIAMAAQDPVE